MTSSLFLKHRFLGLIENPGLADLQEIDRVTKSLPCNLERKSP